MNPAARARISSRTPTTQLISRGRRKAPVKNTRAMCRAIAPTNTSAAQWCVWRISNPPLTSNEMRITESNAAETSVPCSGSYDPS